MRSVCMYVGKFILKDTDRLFANGNHYYLGNDGWQ